MERHGHKTLATALRLAARRHVLPCVAMSLLALPVRAAVSLDHEEFRLYCGYLDALERPEVRRLKGPARDKKIASMAKVKPSVLVGAVARGEQAGTTCDEVGKRAAADARKAVNASVPGRVVVFNFDASDPAHVVAQVTWLGVDKRKVVEEAARIASAIVTEAKIVKTIAIRAVEPAATDKLADEAMWWEAKITGSQAGRIDAAKIKDYATTRYLRLFDGCKTIIDDACIKK